MNFPVAEVSLSPVIPPLIGFAVGALSGMFGVGGGFLITPLLVWCGVPKLAAVGSDLNQMVACASSGATLHFRLGNVSFKLGGLVIAGGLLGALAGTEVARLLHGHGWFDTVFLVLYLVMLGAIAARMLPELKRPPAGTPHSASARRPAAAEEGGAGEARSWELTGGRAALAVALGFAAGFLSAMLGVGGGVILVPVMVYLLSVPTRMAVGTSLFQVVFIAAGSTVFHATRNHTVDVMLAGLVLAGSVPGSWIGVWLGNRLRTRQLRGYFGILVLAAALKIAWDLARRLLAEAPGAATSGPALPSEGIAAWVRDFAVGHGLLYGLAAVAAALVIGVSWGALTRVPRRKT